jgi:hypothetical protein
MNELRHWREVRPLVEAAEAVMAAAEAEGAISIESPHTPRKIALRHFEVDEAALEGERAALAAEASASVAKTPPTPAPSTAPPPECGGGGVWARFWTCDKDAELVTCESVDDAVEDYLDNCDPADVAEMVEITVYGWTPVKYDPDDTERRRLAEDILQGFLENHCEELLNPEDAWWDAVTPRMETASRALVDLIVRELNVWSCEQKQTASITVNVPGWIMVNRPDWLEGGAE